MCPASSSPAAYSTYVHKQDDTTTIVIDEPSSTHIQVGDQVERPIPNANAQQVIVYHRKGRVTRQTLRPFLYRAALVGDWKAAEALCSDVNIACMKITDRGDTILHVAAAAKQTTFFCKLVKCFDEDGIALTNNVGYTAFGVAAVSGAVEIADIMYKKNKNLPKIRGGRENRTPLQTAILMRNRKMVEYLYEITRLEEFDADERMKILESSIHSELYDIALNILEMDRSIVNACSKDRKGRVLLELARKPLSKFGTSHGLIWERFVRILSFVPCFKTMYDSIQARRRATQLVIELCDEIMTLPDVEISKLFSGTPILSEAAKIGNVEFLTLLIQSYPDLIWTLDSDEHSIFHVAVIHRQEKVFRLIHHTGAIKDLLMLSRDPKGNNILHLAGIKPPQNSLNTVCGAALQMQRELLWFKEVEKNLQPSEVNIKNNEKEPKTPRELFNDQHEGLRKAGEEWMKSTANSCMIVAALIATTAFAAAFTIPGGNNGETGAPIFLDDPWFTVFTISNAGAMFSSGASIMMFLSILTSGYGEEDFLFSLPAKLTVGLVSLFALIACISLTFTASLFLAYKEGRQRTLPMFVASFAFFPITLYVLLNLRLWTALFRSTFASKHMFQQGKHKLF